MINTLKYKPQENTDFSKVLRARIRTYFAESGKSIHADPLMVIKTVAVLSLWIGSYALLISGVVPYPYTFFIWAVLGLSVALVTINVGHDAIHGAYSSKKWVNDLLSHTFNLNGASAYMWKRMHNNAHHTHTNVHGHDEDISSVSIIRFSPSDPLKPIHKHQYWYIFGLYSLSTLSWVFIKDYVKFFKNKVGNATGKKHAPSQYFYLFLYKFLCYFIFLAVPLIVMDQPWYLIVAGFLLMHLISGMYLALIFMLAHTVEETHFPVPEESGVLHNDWFVHQLSTTANFCTGNPVAAFFTGGLNQQIEHHLFPNICSTHYPSLSRIIKETANEYNVPYLQNPTFISALKSHVHFLRKLGREEQFVPAA